MSKATRKDTRSPALHVADHHDLIRVQGARVNNLKDVSVDPLQPARETAHRVAQRVLVQRPLGEGQRCDHHRARRRQDEDREGDLTRLGGMCPRCEGMGAVTDFDLPALFDDSLSLAPDQRGR